MKRTGWTIFGTALATLALGAGIFFGATPIGRRIITGYHADMEKAGENTYANKKTVEDTCRAYIASYKADKLAYDQYRNSTDEYYYNLAQSYKMRANSTATTYNEYFLKNSYVWKGNVPSDIVSELPLIDY